MNTIKHLFLLPMLYIIVFSSCKKSNTPVLTELEKLPPITQTGANTFGCLLNGKAWLPKDNFGQPTFELDVDPTFGNGIFVLSAVRYETGSNSTSFSIGSVACTNSGNYNIELPNQNFSYSSTLLGCSFTHNSNNVYRKGSFTITRYDLANRIFSGTFDFTIYKQGCGDTLYFTNGRFDKKL